jgi:hypothetical protein
MSRPFAKALASPTAATSAVALTGPIPGTLESRRILASVRAISTSSASKALMRVEAFPLVKEILHEGADPTAETGGVTLEELAYVVLEPAPSLRDDDAALEQQGPQVVDERGSLADEPLAGAVQGLKVGLRLALHGYMPFRGCAASTALSVASPPRRLPLRRDHRSCAP